ncbi:DUF2304 domain-containing protein [Streptomyces albipurpureus]|uniref:DUF2304 domain-containing protein n=1 Tax=Streptomyces albipurpureus TaxID=2897419 RepID=A0ABT0UE12_9ACTN|nr:DUF2304 domain-containing protein [Streptomyces sp. CWNU-1]MCM2386713.1 DUF2304 domain-containing protein [Streptomyces sp. CWNU-1]
MRLVLLTVVVGLAIVAGLIELLRRRQLREKYAVLWLVTAVFVVVLSVFPSAPDLIAHLLGIRNGISLVLFLSVVFLLAVCMHLTWEASRQDERTRILSEEIALIRLEQDALARPPGPVRRDPVLLVPSPDGRHGNDD